MSAHALDDASAPWWRIVGPGHLEGYGSGHTIPEDIDPGIDFGKGPRHAKPHDEDTTTERMGTTVNDTVWVMQYRWYSGSARGVITESDLDQGFLHSEDQARRVAEKLNAPARSAYDEWVSETGGTSGLTFEQWMNSCGERLYSPRAVQPHTEPLTAEDMAPDPENSVETRWQSCVVRADCLLDGDVLEEHGVEQGLVLRVSATGPARVTVEWLNVRGGLETKEFSAADPVGIRRPVPREEP